MSQSWDVIVVGARCAGATLAALLARRGLKVALLDSAARGSDMPMSTHLLHAPGVRVLDRLGVAARLRAVAPPTCRLRLGFDDFAVTSHLPEGSPSYCVRRVLLDAWLQDAAEQSGATLLERHRVLELLRRGERVTGVVAQTPHGTIELHAPLVVGADGAHSTIAERTRAPEYFVSEGTRAGYWSYYHAPETWTADWDATLEHRGDDLRYVFRADSNLVLLVYMGPRDSVVTWGRDYQARLLQAFAGSETTRGLCEGKTPVGKTIGTLKNRYFYRQPVGPGWALVGDAGHFKDFVTGHGMTDALIDAEHLHEAILDGRPEAYEHYWRARDVRTLPLHFDAIRQGAVGYNTAFMRWLVDRLRARPDLAARIGHIFDRDLAPQDFIPVPALLSMMAAALVRGRLRVLDGFLATARELRAESKELKRREELAASARSRLMAAPRSVPSRAQATQTVSEVLT